MKKAKIMLLAIGIVGAMSGNIAFKAQKFTARTLWYPSIQTSTAPCNFSFSTIFLFTVTAFGTNTAFYSTTSTTVACPTFTTAGF